MSLNRRRDSFTFSEVLRNVIILVKRSTLIIFNIDKIFKISTETADADEGLLMPLVGEDVALNGIWADAAAALPYNIL